MAYEYLNKKIKEEAPLTPQQKSRLLSKGYTPKPDSSNDGSDVSYNDWADRYNSYLTTESTDTNEAINLIREGNDLYARYQHNLNLAHNIKDATESLKSYKNNILHPYTAPATNKYTHMTAEQIQKLLDETEANKKVYTSEHGGEWANKAQKYLSGFVYKDGADLEASVNNAKKNLSAIGDYDKLIAEYNKAYDDRVIGDALGKLDSGKLALLDEYNSRVSANEDAQDANMFAGIIDKSYTPDVNLSALQSEIDAKNKLKDVLGDDWSKLAEYRKRQTDEASMQETLSQLSAEASGHPALSSVATVAMGPAKVMAVRETLKNLISPVEGLKSVNINDPDFIVSRGSNQIRSQVMQDVDWNIGSVDAFDFLYGTGMSMADSVLAMTTGSPAAGGLLLGSQVMADTIVDVTQRGGSAGQALLTGVVAGAFESLFEKISIGQFNALKDVPISSIISKQGIKTALVNIGKSAGVNASEETLTEIADILLDTAVNGSVSSYATTIQQYMAQGMTEDEAKRQVAIDMAKQVFSAGASGALMGVGFGAAASNISATGEMSDRFSTGSALNNSDDMEALYQQTKQYLGEQSRAASDVAKAQAGTQRTGLSGKFANTAENYRVGRAYQQTDRQSIKVAETSANSEYYQNVRSRDDLETRKLLLEHIGSQGENVDTAKAAEEYHALSALLPKSTVATAEQAQSASNTVEGAYSPSEPESPVQANVAQTTGISKEEQAIKTKVYTQPTVMNDGKEVHVINVTKDDDGNAVLHLSNAKTVSVNDADITDPNVAKLYEAYGNYSYDAAKYFIAVAAKAKTNDAEFVTDAFQSYYHAGQTGDSIEYVDSIAPEYSNVFPQEVKERIVKFGKNENPAVTTKQSWEELTPKNAGDFVVDKSVKTKSLDKKIRSSLTALKHIAKATNTRIVAFSDPSDNSPNGYYKPETDTIYINIDGDYAVLQTAAHELTHFMRKHNEAGYQALKDYLLERYHDIGKDDNQELEILIEERKEMARRNKLNSRELSDDAALEEVVADACQNMLRDSNAIKELANKNPSLMKTIKKWLDDFVKAVKEAFSGVDANSKEYEWMKKTVFDLSEFQRMWDNVLVEAVTGKPSTDNYARDYLKNKQMAKGISTEKYNALSDEERAEYDALHEHDYDDLDLDAEDAIPFSDRTGYKYSDRVVDSEGRELSPEQAEFFKDSKVRDENGNLLVVYHGTSEQFTVFDKTKGRANMDIQGMFFSPWDDDAKGYGEYVGAYYLNIVNSADESTAYKSLNMFKGQNGAGIKAREYLESLGYDGVNNGNEEYIAFNSSQIKSVDNLNPTEDNDIRYSDRVTREYSYDTLINKPDMRVTVIDDTIEYTPSKEGRKAVVADAKKNALSVGAVKEGDSVAIWVADVESKVFLATDGLKHGLDRRFQLMAPIVLNGGNIIKNSIRINELTPVKKDATESYVLLGAAINQDDELYIVRSVVNKYNNELASVDVLYSMNTKTEPGGSLSPRLTKNSAADTDSNISISGLLELVNKYFPDILPEDVLRHFGHSYRPDGGIGNSALFSDRLIDERAKELNKAKRKIKALEDTVATLEKGFKLTHGVELDKSKVNGYASRYLREIGSEYGARRLGNELYKLYGQYHRGEMSMNEFLSAGHEISEGVVGSISDITNPEYDYIKQQLHGYKIRLSDKQKAEVSRLQDGTKQFAGKMFGTFAYTNDPNTSDLESLWSELSDMAPFLFPEDTNELDMPFVLEEAVDKMNSGISPFEEGLLDYDDEVTKTALELFEHYLETPIYKSFADKAEERRLNDLAKLKSSYQEKLDNYKAAAKEAREATKAAKKAGQQKLKDYKAKQKLNAQKKIFLNGIEDESKKLSKMLLYPSVGNSIPKILEPSISKFIQSISFEKGTFNRNGYPINHDVSWHKTLLELADIVRQPDAETDFKLPDYIIKSFDNVLTQFSGNLADSIYEQSAADLEILYTTLKAIRSAVSNINAFIASDQKATISAAAMSDINRWKKRKHSMSGNAAQDKAQGVFYWDTMNSFTYFNTLGGAADNIVMKQIADGQIKQYDRAHIAQDYLTSAVSGVPIGEWTGSGAKAKTYDLKDGKITLTIGQIMNLYNLSKREQAVGHIFGYGVVSDEKTIDKLNSLKDKEKAINDGTAGVQLLPEELGIILDTLTDEQKRVAEKLQKFLAVDCAAWGNECSEKECGTDLFRDPDYWTIEVYKNFIATNRSDNLNASLYAIGNQSFTKPTVEGAKNPILIRDAFEVWGEHVSGMAAYSTLSLPIRDAMRWYNYKTNINGKLISTQESLHRAFDTAKTNHASDYFIKLIDDINGDSLRIEQDKTVKFLVGNAKSAAVTMNVSVAAQQACSYYRAMAVIDPKYLKQNPAHAARNAILAKKYCSIAWWKSQGHYETDIGRGILDVVLNRRSTFQKVKDAGMLPAQKMDEMTWGVLWGACESETKDTRKELEVGSEKYYEVVAARLTDIINQTQVVDTVLHRSQSMRRNDSVLRSSLLTFVSEPMANYNLMTRAIHSGNKRFITRAFVGVALSQVAAAAISAAIRAFRDPDDEKKYSEKFKGEFVTGLIRSLSPLSVIPYVNLAQDTLVEEGVSIASGKGWVYPNQSASLDQQFIYSAYSAVHYMVKLIQNRKDASPTELRNDSYMFIYSTAKTVSQVTGIGISNLVRDLTAVWNAYSDKNIGYNYKATDKYEVMRQAIVDGDTETYDRTYARLKEDGKDDDAIESGIKKALKDNDPRIQQAAVAYYDARKTGDWDKSDTIQSEIIADGFDYDMVAGAFNSAYNAYVKSIEGENPTTALSGKYSELADSVKMGWRANSYKTAQELVAAGIDEYVAEGMSRSEAKKKVEGNIRSSLTGKFKEQYYELKYKAYTLGDESAKRQLTDMKNALKALKVGYDSESFRNWDGGYVEWKKENK